MGLGCGLVDKLPQHTHGQVAELAVFVGFFDFILIEPDFDDDAGFVAIEHGVFNFVGAVGFAFAIGRGHDEGLQHFAAGQVLQDQAFLHVFGHIAAHVLEGVGGHIGYAAISVDVNLMFEFGVVEQIEFEQKLTEVGGHDVSLCVPAIAAVDGHYSQSADIKAIAAAYF